MKKLLIILLSALSLTAYAQGKKTVAVLDPICRDNSVSGFYQLTVRGAMETAVTMSKEYEAYDRSAFDQIQKEQAFQRTGAVNDSQIKKMGEMAGVDYVLVSEVSAEAGYLSAVFKILNVTTGKYDKTVNDIMQLSPTEVKSKCEEKASSLFGDSKNSTNTTTSTPSPSQSNINYEYYFGRIREDGGRVSHTFRIQVRFTDISDVRASCGCTTIQHEADPSNPEVTLLTVTFNPNGRPGGFHKTTTITLTNGIVIKVHVKGTVIPRQK